jgi:N-methylhydantoinase A
MTAKITAAVDIGGTFTDVVLDSTGVQNAVKVLTTYDDPANGVLAGLAEVCELAGVAPGEIQLLLHGTTLATNALIERRGAVTALLTTRGHRDALEMALENRFEQYDLDIDRPVPLVPRYLRLPIDERMDAAGRVLVDLDEQSVEQVIGELKLHKVESVAVGLLHSFANPQHEQRIGELLAQALPEVAVSLSSTVCPEIREYERLSTTCANAYVKPLMGSYLLSLEQQLTARGFIAPLLLMTSGGGLTTLAAAREFPIRLVESGPAGGAILAAHICATTGVESALSFDMGGTTAKLCILNEAQPLYSRSFEVDRSYRFKRGSGLPIRIPVIEMVEIGAGGGSLARVDALGRTQVGPESAGSEPGPACYGRGGQGAAVTDADLVLGKIDPQRFADGRIRLDVAAAQQALLANVGERLDLSAREAAHAVGEVVNENMATAARAHLAEWGQGVAGRTLIAFGGAAPLHASVLAHKLKLDRVIVPANAGVGSAVGFLLAPVSFEVVRSRYMRVEAMDQTAITDIMQDMREEALAVVGGLVPAQELVETRKAYMRYLGQGYEVAVTLDDEGPIAAEQLRDQFEAAYQALYGRIIPGLTIEILSWTLALTGPLPRQPDTDTVYRLTRRSSRLRRELLDVVAGELVQAECFQRRELVAGDWLRGPALVEEAATTVFVACGFEAQVSGHGHLVISREESI